MLQFLWTTELSLLLPSTSMFPQPQLRKSLFIPVGWVIITYGGLLEQISCQGHAQLLKLPVPVISLYFNGGLYVLGSDSSQYLVHPQFQVFTKDEKSYVLGNYFLD